MRKYKVVFLEVSFRDGMIAQIDRRFLCGCWFCFFDSGNFSMSKEITFLYIVHKLMPGCRKMLD